MVGLAESVQGRSTLDRSIRRTAGHLRRSRTVREAQSLTGSWTPHVTQIQFVFMDATNSTDSSKTDVPERSILPTRPDRLATRHSCRLTMASLPRTLSSWNRFAAEESYLERARAESAADRLGGGGFFEAVKVRAQRRTGVSDTAGICSVQMPDSLVVCFTYNNQSIQGAGRRASNVHPSTQGPVLTRFRKAIGAESGRFLNVQSAAVRRSGHRCEPIVHNRFWHGNASL